MNSRKIIITTLAIALVAACATGPQRPASTVGDNYAFTHDYLPRLIREKMQERKIVGLSIAIVDDQGVAWAQGFGFADKENSVRATPETIYRAGSITKLFTATATMQLAESGKLDIDQPLQNYLPEFSIRSRFVGTRPITLRDLMTHHSGLPSDHHNGSWGDDAANFTDIAMMLKDEYVATPPDTIESYSNLGFSLLGHVIERVSGETYADYIENWILRPVGMQHAYIASNLNDDERRSKGYVKKKAHPTPSLRDVPAGGLSCSVIDLARFAQMTFDGGARGGNQVLRPETLAEMQNFQDTDGTFDLHPSVGLAWRLVDSMGDDAGVMAGHNGGTPMFYSEFLTLPTHKLAGVRIVGAKIGAEAAVVGHPEVLHRCAVAHAGKYPAGAVAGPPAAAVLGQRFVLDFPVANVTPELRDRALHARRLVTEKDRRIAGMRHQGARHGQAGRENFDHHHDCPHLSCSGSLSTSKRKGSVPECRLSEIPAWRRHSGVRIVGAKIGAEAAVVGHPEVLHRCAVAHAGKYPAGAVAGPPAAAVLGQRFVLDFPVANVTPELRDRALHARRLVTEKDRRIAGMRHQGARHGQAGRENFDHHHDCPHLSCSGSLSTSKRKGSLPECRLSEIPAWRRHDTGRFSFSEQQRSGLDIELLVPHRSNFVAALMRDRNAIAKQDSVVECRGYFFSGQDDAQKIEWVRRRNGD